MICIHGAQDIMLCYFSQKKHSRKLEIIVQGWGGVGWESRF